MIGQRRGSGIFLLVLTVLLAGCLAEGSSAQSSRARHLLGEVVKSVAGDRPDDINGFARSVVSSIDGDRSARGLVHLVGIEEKEPASLSEPFGVLTFRVQLAGGETGVQGEGPFDACFAVEFDYYGVSDQRIWESSDYLREESCSASVSPVTPPIDTSIHFVVADNAEAAATEVLSDETSRFKPDGSDITARILGLLDAPVGEFQQVAPPTVIVDKGNVGVAMGSTPDDCVLVSRIDGIVSRVMPAPILLERGELGCQPGTALQDPAQLRSPH
ncbi:hypothetical protein [Cryobacterium sp. PH31-O1]|uniref:hypothetical protein n=1 Tax=Cryobacterium sp. PH31-O1 TaxID=3046306 RepID=UPI0024BBA990|nr:hypothetical protein [Cryobacterium sp. PH31-O1]MDJ0339215.1 hypothetical protein [Cryobacterium sp. PH31-O1]